MNNAFIEFAIRGDELYVLEEIINDENQKWILILLADDSFGWVIGEPIYVTEKLVTIDNLTYQMLLRISDSAKRFYGVTFSGQITNSANPIPTSTPQPANIPPSTTLLSADTQNYVGSQVSCKILRARCFYYSDAGGGTNCYDLPAPSNNFTLLVQGKDWTDYKGQCIIVTGHVVTYIGKPTIVAYTRSQVSSCPGDNED